MSTNTSSSPRSRKVRVRPQKNAELQQMSMHSAEKKLSLHQHFQQDDGAKEEATMKSLIMHRFLPAAEDVAAAHASFMASLLRKNHSEALSSSWPKQSQRTIITHHMKSRAQQPPKNYAPSSRMHSGHKEESTPHSMRSPCLVLHICTYCPVSTSGCSMPRKKSWTLCRSDHVKADKGTSFLSSEMEGQVARKKKARRCGKEHQSGINVDVPILHPSRSFSRANGREITSRHARKYHASFSTRGIPSSDVCSSAGHNPPFSQSEKVNLGADGHQNMMLMHCPYDDDDHIDVKKFVCKALEKQGKEETVQEAVASSNQRKPFDCALHYAENLPPHDLADENMCISSLYGSETNSHKSAHEYHAFESSWQVVDDDEDDEPQLFDALSMLSSVKSDASSHFFETPCTATSENKLVPSRICAADDRCTSGKISSLRKSVGKGAKLETDNKQVVSPQEHDSCAYHPQQADVRTRSENKSVPSHICAADDRCTSGKMSSLRKSVGKGVELETDNKQVVSPQKHDSCAYHPQQADVRTRRSARLWHRSLDSMSGLYHSEASMISPVFPAKCWRNSANASGWPFGTSGYQSSRVGGGSPYNIQQEKHLEKHVVGGNVPPPPLPPAPTEPWLWKAVKTNASKPSPLGISLQQEKVASMKMADSISANPDAERRWENVVKSSRVHRGHLRYSKELEIIMLTSL